jgi:SsrA-binding protein
MSKIYSKNKKAYFDYEIIETLEAGISLSGAEVKSVRASNVQLKGSYVVIKDGQIKLVGAHISRPDHIGNKPYDEMRDRSLLISKKQLNKFHEQVKMKGLTLVALNIYQPDDSKKIKVEIALVKGKALHDKRAVLKEKQLDMDTKRQMKDYK